MSREITSPHKPKVIISKELAAQIGYLHNKCPNKTEWSGLLIFEVLEGSVVELDKLRIKAHGVFPMDFGDATFTSFEGNEDWLKCFQTYPQIDPIAPKEGWYCAKIHSHHNMPVFHSQTDKNDLYTNAPKLPLFLSLIVNYECNTDCELAIALETEEITKWKLKGQTDYEQKVEQKSATYVMKCEVEYEQDDWFKQQIISLATKSNRSTTPTYTPKQFQQTAGTGTASQETVRKFVMSKILDNFSELVTLGEVDDLPALGAMNKANDNLTIKEKDIYKKAVKMYFSDEWYLTYFYNVDSDEKEIIQGILNLLAKNQGWIVTVLTETFNELKTEYTKLRTFQGNTLVY